MRRRRNRVRIRGKLARALVEFWPWDEDRADVVQRRRRVKRIAFKPASQELTFDERVERLMEVDE